MHHLDVTLGSPEENLALDEALLDRAEQGGEAGDILRLWEPPTPLVVLGRSSRLEQEVNETECRRLDIRRVNSRASLQR